MGRRAPRPAGEIPRSMTNAPTKATNAIPAPGFRDPRTGARGRGGAPDPARRAPPPPRHQAPSPLARLRPAGPARPLLRHPARRAGCDPLAPLVGRAIADLPEDASPCCRAPTRAIWRSRPPPRCSSRCGDTRSTRAFTSRSSAPSARASSPPRGSASARTASGKPSSTRSAACSCRTISSCRRTTPSTPTPSSWRSTSSCSISAPHLVLEVFPTLDDCSDVDAAIAEDVDAARLLDACRPAGAEAPRLEISSPSAA